MVFQLKFISSVYLSLSFRKQLLRNGKFCRESSNIETRILEFWFIGSEIRKSIRGLAFSFRTQVGTWWTVAAAGTADAATMM